MNSLTMASRSTRSTARSSQNHAKRSCNRICKSRLLFFRCQLLRCSHYSPCETESPGPTWRMFSRTFIHHGCRLVAKGRNGWINVRSDELNVPIRRQVEEELSVCRMRRFLFDGRDLVRYSWSFENMHVIPVANLPCRVSVGDCGFLVGRFTKNHMH